MDPLKSATDDFAQRFKEGSTGLLFGTVASRPCFPEATQVSSDGVCAFVGGNQILVVDLPDLSKHPTKVIHPIIQAKETPEVDIGCAMDENPTLKFRQVKWSPRGCVNAPTASSCVLAALSTDFQIRLYCCSGMPLSPAPIELVDVGLCLLDSYLDASFANNPFPVPSAPSKTFSYTISIDTRCVFVLPDSHMDMDEGKHKQIALKRDAALAKLTRSHPARKPEQMQLRKDCVSALSVSWSPIFEDQQQRFVFLAVGTKAGLVSVWCLHLPIVSQAVPVLAGFLSVPGWVTGLGWGPLLSSPAGFRAVLLVGSSLGSGQVFLLSVEPGSFPKNSGEKSSKSSADARTRVLKSTLVSELTPQARNRSSVVCTSWLLAGDRLLLALGRGSDIHVCLFDAQSLQIIGECEMPSVHLMSISSLHWGVPANPQVLISSSFDGPIKMWTLHVEGAGEVRLELIQGEGTEAKTPFVMGEFGVCPTPDNLMLVAVTQCEVNDSDMFKRMEYPCVLKGCMFVHPQACCVPPPPGSPFTRCTRLLSADVTSPSAVSTLEEQAVLQVVNTLLAGLEQPQLNNLGEELDGKQVEKECDCSGLPARDVFTQSRQQLLFPFSIRQSLLYAYKHFEAYIEAHSPMEVIHEETWVKDPSEVLSPAQQILLQAQQQQQTPKTTKSYLPSRNPMNTTSFSLHPLPPICFTVPVSFVRVLLRAARHLDSQFRESLQTHIETSTSPRVLWEWVDKSLVMLRISNVLYYAVEGMHPNIIVPSGPERGRAVRCRHLNDSLLQLLLSTSFLSAAITTLPKAALSDSPIRGPCLAHADFVNELVNGIVVSPTSLRPSLAAIELAIQVYTACDCRAEAKNLETFLSLSRASQGANHDRYISPAREVCPYCKAPVRFSGSEAQLCGDGHPLNRCRFLLTVAPPLNCTSCIQCGGKISKLPAEFSSMKCLLSDGEEQVICGPCGVRAIYLFHI